MHLLVTRPIEDASALAVRLQAAGHSVTVDPLLSIILKSDVPLDRTRVQALLVTSANGLRALGARADFSVWQTVPIYAVGPTTAGMARDLGFDQVVEAQGDVVSLAALAIDALDPDAGPVIHVSGTVTAGDLRGTLERAGLWVETAVLYEAKAADALAPETAAALAAGEIDGVLLYSRRSAEIFVELCKKATPSPDIEQTHAFCLSGNAAAPLQSLSLASIQVALRPNETELLALIEP